MIKEIKHEGKTLRIISDIGEAVMTLNEEIKTVLKFPDSVIVRTAHDPREGARNIHRINEKGEKIWTIETPEGVKGMANAFMDLWVDKQGNLMAGAWQGTEHKIDFETGKIISSKFTK